MKKARATKREKKRIWKTMIIIKNNQIRELKFQTRELERIICDQKNDLYGYEQDYPTIEQAYDGIAKAFNAIESHYDRLKEENKKLKKDNKDLKDQNLELELKLLQYGEEIKHK